MASSSKKVNGHKRGIADDTPLLTPALVRQLEAELKADKRLLQELPARIALAEKKLEAARLFMPSAEQHAVLAEVTTEPEAENHDNKPKVSFRTFQTGPNWSQMVYEALDNANRGLTIKELRQETMGSPLRDRDSPGDRGMYQAIQRLVKTGDAIRHGGMLYSARVYKELQARGEQLPDLTADVYKPRRSGQIVLHILANHRDGLTLDQLRDAISAVPEAPPSARVHRQYIYNVLGPLLGSGNIVKAGEVYRLPDNAKG